MAKTGNICHNITKMQKPIQIESILNTFYKIYKNIKFTLLKTQLSDGASDQNVQGVSKRFPSAELSINFLMHREW